MPRKTRVREKCVRWWLGEWVDMGKMNKNKSNLQLDSFYTIHCISLIVQILF